jgi:hypothetical protein
MQHYVGLDVDSEEPLPGNLPGTGLQLSERALNGGTRTYSRQTQPLAVPLRSSLLGKVQCLELSREQQRSRPLDAPSSGKWFGNLSSG